jgi:phosphoribosylanthranilate isomerase
LGDPAGAGYDPPDGSKGSHVLHSRVRVKICGVTRLDDALSAADAGADWIGLNFQPASPRRVDTATARSIATALPKSVQAVGVFVNRPPSEIAETARQVGLSIVQLHGEEPPEDLLALKSLQVIRAFRLAGRESLGLILAHLLRCEALGRPPDAVLIDAYRPGLQGGTGLLIEDELLAELPPLPRLILAGGLTPENVAERVARVNPWMVDVASGVESAPGCKDTAKVAAFLRATKGR